MKGKALIKNTLKSTPKPPLIGSVVLAITFVLAVIAGLDMAKAVSEILQRSIQWGIIVLAMLPTIKSGMGVNFGLQVGIISGLLGMYFAAYVLAEGIYFIIISMVLAIVIGGILGLFYGWIMNRVKGHEMQIGLFVGFACTWFFCLAWFVMFKLLPQVYVMSISHGIRQYIAIVRVCVETAIT